MHKIIDPHVHFFDLAQGEYAWLLPQNQPHWPDKALINKNTMPDSLQVSDHCLLLGAVHVEAGFDNLNPKNELDWLESQVYPQAPLTQFSTIGFIDICADSNIFQLQLDGMKSYPTLCGFRYIFDAHTPMFEQKAQIMQNLSLISQAGLLLEFQADFTNTALIRAVISLLYSLPELKIVINHAGLPPQNDSGSFGLWKENMRLFAHLPKCYVKCSGFEMTSRQYTVEHVCSVLSATVDLFGEDRMMIASNFPLTSLTMSYFAYWELMIACAQQIGLELDKVLNTNAKDLYGFA
ncbi:hypothetical protein GPUN_0741 [Glaciecola punicea ACAM 611]|uniref:Amidohydrolase-related domain-containing protein n=1 Tax=Glaciecola punicea ACAM 611 TaxID=1121923 RepID=H5T9A2_9ALTE|nr:amidohydrolase family protein [Glaciecola punicea]OFA33156.1 hypothetical protein BAE46_00085 [Glaciecola punicea]GAB54879.1 hypothetical protein GPUN_0741 [Glaciecola punicea ACAM 611]